ncbi:MAG: SIMPL domain-containing protein [Lachnospiraceae bacterium]|nr:SIMPL domain-containing protein [Lachnospiraceae bacterium]
MGTIKVTGRGRMSLRPDTVVIDMSLTRSEKEYEAAVKKSTEQTKEVRKAFEELGFKKEDVKTGHFSIDPEYESYQEKNIWKTRFKGYIARQTLKVRFERDTDKLGQVLYAVAHLKSEPTFNISYTVKDTEAAKNELLKKAVEDSRIKAEVLADAAGVKLGEIENIDYSWGTIDIVTRPVNNLAMPRMMKAASAAEEAAAYNVDVEPENIEIDDTVTVIWNIK